MTAKTAGCGGGVEPEPFAGVDLDDAGVSGVVSVPAHPALTGAEQMDPDPAGSIGAGRVELGRIGPDANTTIPPAATASGNRRSAPLRVGPSLTDATRPIDRVPSRRWPPRIPPYPNAARFPARALAARERTDPRWFYPPGNYRGI